MPEMSSANYNPDVLCCLANLSSDEIFTPPDLVNAMLDTLPPQLFCDPKATFLDPCCKSGVFLREIAKRLIVGLAPRMPDLQQRLDHIFHRQLYGIAITELTALLARRSLYCSKYPNSRFSVSRFTTAEGNIRYRPTQHTWQNGRCTFCGAPMSKYERESELESFAYEIIHVTQPKEIWKMKFDVIVGNPPYQLNVGTKKENYAIPIYQKFVTTAKSLNPRYIVMITPSRWFTGGRGLEEYRDEMLNDSRLRRIVDYPNSKDCFPGVDISGGVNYFLWERDYAGKCDFSSVHDGKTHTCKRDLNEFPIFPRYNEALSIIHRVKKKNERTLVDSVSAQTPFGFITTYRGKSETFPGAVTLVSSSGNSFVRASDISRNQAIVNKYKVIFSKATCEHAGIPDKNGQFRVISSSRILGPGEVCSQSYLVGGYFDTKIEAENFLCYLKTKFARFLLLQALASQDISREKFMFVPKQDYSKLWTDEKLYCKYGLIAEEISFIENTIRPME